MSNKGRVDSLYKFYTILYRVFFIMVLTKDIIKKKWEQKLEIMREKAEYKYRVVFENKKKLFDKRLDYEAIKVEKKKNAYIRKKEEEYKRKMLNDIRALE